MREVELVQDPGDKDRWVLPGVGSFLRTGRVSRGAIAEAGKRRWSIKRFGLVRTGFNASDEAGTVVGEVRNPISGRSDGLRWAGRDLRQLRDGPRRWGYALCDGDRRLAVMTPKPAAGGSSTSSSRTPQSIRASCSSRPSSRRPTRTTRPSHRPRSSDPATPLLDRGGVGLFAAPPSPVVRGAPVLARAGGGPSGARRSVRSKGGLVRSRHAH